jgi:hypothetical protein
MLCFRHRYSRLPLHLPDCALPALPASSENAPRINHQPAGRVKDQTHMEGKNNEKMVIVDDAWPVEHPAVGLWL